MKRFIVCAVVIGCVGCTSLRPIAGTSTELQQRIGSGELIKAGDRVSIVTTDQKTHQFAVSKIDAGVIVGKADSVPVEQVASVGKREFSRTKTLVLVGGVILVVAGGAVIIAAQTAPAFAL